MQTGGAPRSARIPFEGDILTNTDFCSSTTDCTHPFADRGNPKSSLPTKYLGAQFICDLVAGATGPDRARPDGLLHGQQCALRQSSKKRLT